MPVETKNASMEITFFGAGSDSNDRAAPRPTAEAAQSKVLPGASPDGLDAAGAMA